MSDLKRYRYDTLCCMVEDNEHSSDQATVVLTLHVSTEFWLDSLLRHRCQLTEEELEAFDLSYSKKLTVLKKLNRLPDDIHKNLKTLNELRNRYAHRLDYSLGEDLSDFNFIASGIDLGAYVAIVKDDWRKRPIEWWKKALVDIIRATIKRLEEYCIKEVGLPEPEDG